MIQGVSVIRLDERIDGSGRLIEVARAAGSTEANAIIDRFGNVNFVDQIPKGSTRSTHKHARMVHWFYVCRGTVRFLCQDDRRDCASYGTTLEIISRAGEPTLIAIPPGVYHAWTALEDDTALLSIGSEASSPAGADMIRPAHDMFTDSRVEKGGLA